MKQMKIHVTYLIILIFGISLSIFSVIAIKGHRDKIQHDYSQKNKARILCQTCAEQFYYDIIDDECELEDEIELSEKDPWGHPIKLRRDQIGTRRIFRIISHGPDGEIGTKDDIIETRHMMCK